MSDAKFVSAMADMLLSSRPESVTGKQDEEVSYSDSRRPKIVPTSKFPIKALGGTESTCVRCLTCLSEMVTAFGQGQSHTRHNVLHVNDLNSLERNIDDAASTDLSDEGVSANACVICAKLIQLFGAAKLHVAFDTDLRSTPHSQWSMVWTLEEPAINRHPTSDSRSATLFGQVMLTARHEGGYGWGIGSFRLYPDDDPRESQHLEQPAISALDGDSKLFASTLSQGSLMQMSKWIGTCLQTHKKCDMLLTQLDGKSEPTPMWKPDRLLELRTVEKKGSRANESGEVEIKGKIVTTKVTSSSTSAMHPDTIKYLTLSHCWGPAPDPMAKLGGRSDTVLTQDKYKAWQEDVPLDVLPLTFQHAIKITASLGCSYLWIDSLCIIQDSIVDWQEQSAVMGDIYKYAAINLAALSSTSDYDGFINDDRDTRVVFGFRAPFASILGRKEEEVNVRGEVCRLLKGQTRLIWTFQSDVPGSCASNAPLFSRAWVFQERALAKRTLAFTHQGVFWQCDEVSESEQPKFGLLERQGLRYALHARMDGLVALAQRVVDQSLSNEEKMRLYKEYRDGVLRSYDQQWYLTVMNYTLCQLTKGTDKLIAISSVARELSDDTIWSYRYLAGLWDVNLCSQLSWITVQGPKTPRRRVAGEVGYIAPSWSWASLEAKVQPRFIFYGDSHRALIDVTRAETVLETGFAFGPVKAGWLRMRGHLREFRIVGTQLEGDRPKVFACDDQSGDNLWILPDTVECIKECQRLHDLFQRIGFPQESHMAHLRWLPLILQANKEILRCTGLFLVKLDAFAAMVDDTIGFVHENDQVYRRLGTIEFSIRANTMRKDRLGLMRSVGSWPDVDTSTEEAQAYVDGFGRRDSDFTEFVLV